MRLYSLFANSEYRSFSVAGSKSNPQIVLRPQDLVALTGAPVADVDQPGLAA